MGSLFSPNSMFMRVMNRVGDLLVLNLLFLLCCVPVVTIGAASTALYTVCFRLGTDRERGLVKSFFAAFRENFRQSTILWLILLVFCIAAAVNTSFCYYLPGALRYLVIPFGIMLALVVMTTSYVFPLLSQFSNGAKATVQNAFFLAVGYLPRSIVVAALNLAPFVCLLFDFYLFLQLGFVWAALYFSAAAYANTFLLKTVFKLYQPEEEAIDDRA